MGDAKDTPESVGAPYRREPQARRGESLPETQERLATLRRFCPINAEGPLYGCRVEGAQAGMTPSRRGHRRLERRVPLSILARLIQAGIVAVAIAVATWSTVRREPDVPTGVVLLIAVIVGLAGPIDDVERTLAGWVGTVSLEFRLKIEEPLKGLLVSLTQATTIPWAEIGLTVFLVKRTRRYPIRGVQLRVARLRMRSSPRPTAIVWTRNKGLLGQCWQQQRDVNQDHEKVYGQMQVTRSAWKSASPDTRSGLSYQDFLTIRHFGYVLASPILKDGRYKGCIVVQVLPGYADELSKPDSLDAIHLTADTIALLL